MLWLVQDTDCWWPFSNLTQIASRAAYEFRQARYHREVKGVPAIGENVSPGNLRVEVNGGGTVAAQC